ncbi:MAG: hypothetical protein ACI8SE_001658 [Bacteroidia bacterium]|jgi:hypothetical protein
MREKRKCAVILFSMLFSCCNAFGQTVIKVPFKLTVNNQVELLPDTTYAVLKLGSRNISDSMIIPVLNQQMVILADAKLNYDVLQFHKDSITIELTFTDSNLTFKQLVEDVHFNDTLEIEYIDRYDLFIETVPNYKGKSTKENFGFMVRWNHIGKEITMIYCSFTTDVFDNH